MASPDLLPYNVSLTDQSAIIRFFPHRDGAVDDNWNVTYSGSSFAKWSYDNTFGAGVSSHRTTLVGAYILIDWAGTAVWLYGTGEKGSYSVRIGQESLVEGQGDADGLLFSQTGLTYGLHTANLTVLAGEVSITGAIITVGMGESGTVLQTRNISATENNTSPPTGNPVFDGNENWSVDNLYTNQSSGYPCIATSTLDATLSFTVNESVGFVIYGSDDWQQGLFTVAVTSDDIGATDSVTNSTIQYSPRALWTQVGLPKYLATGLDRSATYQVEIQNLGANFNLASVVVYDAIPGPSPSSSGALSSGTAPSPTSGPVASSSSSSSSSNTSHSHTSAIIAGVVVGGASVVLIFLFAMWWRRRRRQRLLDEVSAPNPFVEDPPKHEPGTSMIPPLKTDCPHAASSSSLPSGSGTNSAAGASSTPGESTEPESLMGEVRPRILPYAGSDFYETIGSRLHERDAGPAIQPPLYDPAWAELNTHQPSQTPLQRTRTRKPQPAV
ncbi:hypothetical protein DAEQUDRAFT_726112 [Daedalea quercina L-15889]|uniref:Transmembrane protein n=1 Tax=Daedalea quercina L-15889 TaxID=1314783 RepID=A0A165QQT3_9APHY|nr:hypothetical protein DAEQUDRAFT_726112 [Daedalea quercina L-15889]